MGFNLKPKITINEGFYPEEEHVEFELRQTNEQMNSLQGFPGKARSFGAKA